MERLTIDGADGIRTFCSGCSDKPMLGKCDIGNECYHRQVFKALRAYENTDLTPDEITAAADRHHNCKINCLLEEYNKVVDERDTLKKALELALQNACGEAGTNSDWDLIGCPPNSKPDDCHGGDKGECHNCWVKYYIQQAQEGQIMAGSNLFAIGDLAITPDGVGFGSG